MSPMHQRYGVGRVSRGSSYPPCGVVNGCGVGVKEPWDGDVGIGLRGVSDKHLSKRGRVVYLGGGQMKGRGCTVFTSGRQQKISVVKNSKPVLLWTSPPRYSPSLASGRVGRPAPPPAPPADLTRYFSGSRNWYFLINRAGSRLNILLMDIMVTRCTSLFTRTVPASSPTTATRRCEVQSWCAVSCFYTIALISQPTLDALSASVSSVSEWIPECSRSLQPRSFDSALKATLALFTKLENEVLWLHQDMCWASIPQRQLYPSSPTSRHDDDEKELAATVTSRNDPELLLCPPRIVLLVLASHDPVLVLALAAITPRSNSFPSECTLTAAPAGSIELQVLRWLALR
eukprot:766040-Hanusia_phi.AAC.1